MKKKVEVHAQFEPGGRYVYIYSCLNKFTARIYIWRSKRVYHKTVGPYLEMVTTPKDS